MRRNEEGGEMRERARRRRKEEMKMGKWDVCWMTVEK